MKIEARKVEGIKKISYYIIMDNGEKQILINVREKTYNEVAYMLAIEEIRK